MFYQAKIEFLNFFTLINNDRQKKCCIFYLRKSVQKNAEPCITLTSYNVEPCVTLTSCNADFYWLAMLYKGDRSVKVEGN